MSRRGQRHHDFVGEPSGVGQRLLDIGHLEIGIGLENLVNAVAARDKSDERSHAVPECTVCRPSRSDRT